MTLHEKVRITLTNIPNLFLLLFFNKKEIFYSLFLKLLFGAKALKKEVSTPSLSINLFSNFFYRMLFLTRTTLVIPLIFVKA